MFFDFIVFKIDMDFSKFSDDNFDVKEWVNSALRIRDDRTPIDVSFIIESFMHQSIPAAPIPPPGNCGAFVRIVSPGGRALSYPRASRGLLTHVVSDSKSKRR